MKEIIKLTKLNFKINLPINTVAFSFAASGAQGCPGEIVAIGGNAQIYSLNYVYGDLSIEEVYEILPLLEECDFNVFSGGKFPKGWSGIYMGGGNYLVVCNPIITELKNRGVELEDTLELYHKWIDLVLDIMKEGSLNDKVEKGSVNMLIDKNERLEKVHQMPSEREYTKHNIVTTESESTFKESNSEVGVMSYNLPTMLKYISALLILMGCASIIRLDIFSFFLSIYSVWLLVKRKGNAIFVAVGLLSISFLMFILALLLTNTMSIAILLGLIFRGYFIYYLTQSEDMELFIPQEERYYKIRDIVLLGAYIFWIIILISNA